MRVIADAPSSRRSVVPRARRTRDVALRCAAAWRGRVGRLGALATLAGAATADVRAQDVTAAVSVLPVVIGDTTWTTRGMHSVNSTLDNRVLVLTTIGRQRADGSREERLHFLVAFPQREGRPAGVHGPAPSPLAAAAWSDSVRRQAARAGAYAFPLAPGAALFLWPDSVQVAGTTWRAPGPDSALVLRVDDFDGGMPPSVVSALRVDARIPDEYQDRRGGTSQLIWMVPGRPLEDLVATRAPSLEWRVTPRVPRATRVAPPRDTAWRYRGLSSGDAVDGERSIEYAVVQERRGEQDHRGWVAFLAVNTGPPGAHTVPASDVADAAVRAEERSRRYLTRLYADSGLPFPVTGGSGGRHGLVYFRDSIVVAGRTLMLPKRDTAVVLLFRQEAAGAPPRLCGTWRTPAALGAESFARSWRSGDTLFTAWPTAPTYEVAWKGVPDSVRAWGSQPARCATPLRDLPF
jgi:hypothetical protein